MRSAPHCRPNAAALPTAGHGLPGLLGRLASTNPRSGTGPRLAAAPARPLWRRLLDGLAALEARHRAARRLAALEPHLLADVGLTAQDAAREAARLGAAPAPRRPG